MSESPPLLELSEVSKSFSGTTALRPTDLAIRPGATTVLIGPSGCGKSTLLRLMICLIQPDTGSIRFEGSPLANSDVTSLRHRMGYVIQDGGLFPHLTARGNVCLLARHLGWESRRLDVRLTELAELTHFPLDGLDRFPAQLSGGQKQRVSLMRALMLDPDVLLLDEPLGALDPIVRSELQADLREIFRSLAKTVVLVTHDIGEAGFFGDVIVLLREGEIIQQGSLDDLVTAPADSFVTRFINAQRTAVAVLGGVR
jgi:osmoprotectant transport system ATP-binding protein